MSFVYFRRLLLSSSVLPSSVLPSSVLLSSVLSSRVTVVLIDLGERTAAAGRAARNAYSNVTLAAHEICKEAYPDPEKLKSFLESASKDWYNPDYHVYFMM
jgi:hypothetical protein